MLISETYRAEQQRLHELPNYGVMGHAYGALVRGIMTQMGVQEVLDYGAGKQALKQYMYPGTYYRAYDPGVEELAETPKPAQFVTCIDVLEHIEPELLDNVLDDLKRVTLQAIFATVHCGPAVKILSDGRNAHLIQQPVQWWLPKLMDRFDVHTFSKDEHGFWIVGYAC